MYNVSTDDVKVNTKLSAFQHKLPSYLVLKADALTKQTDLKYGKKCW